MKKKFKLIAPSLAVIVVCLLLMVGSTFAIFTSFAETSISVTSGKVDLDATLTNLEAYSAEAVDSLQEGDEDAGTASAFGVTSQYKYVERTTAIDNGYSFANGGGVTLQNNALSLVKVTPGDKAVVQLNLVNNSNVNIKYRLRYNVTSDNGLQSGLKIKVLTPDANTEPVEYTTEELNGIIKVGKWTNWNAPATSPETKSLKLVVELPVNAGNEYQLKTAELRFTVEAVQGNAKVDTVLEEVNDYLALQAQTSKNKTMSEAIEDVNTWAGLEANADKTFVATNYLWNMDTDQFYDESTIVHGFDHRFYKAYTQTKFNNLEEQTYSVYAKDTWTGDVENLTVGFDAGSTTGIDSVSYDRHDAETGQEVYIRTNSANTNVTVNAPKDVVHHYGTAGTLNIIAVAGQSYHEHGKVAFLEIKKGRVALEETSTVSTVHIASTTFNSGTLEVKTEFDEIVVAVKTTTQPEFSRDDVEIASTGTLVVALEREVQTSQETTETVLDYVWLTKQGIYEQIKVSDNSEDAGNEWVNTSNKPDETKTAAQQIANNINRTNNQIDVTVTVTETNTQVEKTYKVALNENRDLVVVEDTENPDVEQPVATIAKSGNVTVGETHFNISLDKNSTSKVTEVVVKQGEEVVSHTNTVTNSGISTEEQKDAAIAEAISTQFDLTHHEAVAATCTADGHNAYDSWYEGSVLMEPDKVVYPALGHDVNTETGVCSRCNTQVYYYKVGETLYKSNQFSAAWTAAKNSDNAFVLLANKTLNALQANGTFVVDLNGHTLTLNGHPQAGSDGTTGAAIFIDGGANWSHGNLTVKNGTLNMNGTGYSKYGIYNYGSITLKDLTINSACEYAVEINGQAWGTVGATNLDNVTINSTHNNGYGLHALSLKNWAGTLKPTVHIEKSTITALKDAVELLAVDATIEDCTFAGNNNSLFIGDSAMASGVVGNISMSGEVNLNAGTRLNKNGSHVLTITAGLYNFDPTQYVAEGYAVKDNGNSTWTVAEAVACAESWDDEQEKWVQNYYTSLQEAVDNELLLNADDYYPQMEIILLCDVNEDFIIPSTDPNAAIQFTLSSYTLSGTINITAQAVAFIDGILNSNITAVGKEISAGWANGTVTLGYYNNPNYGVTFNGNISVKDNSCFIIEEGSGSTHTGTVTYTD